MTRWAIVPQADRNTGAPGRGGVRPSTGIAQVAPRRTRTQLGVRDDRAEHRDVMTSDSLFVDVVDRALAEVRRRSIRIYTFAFYHDHESSAVSVCVDTQDNSERVVRGINAYNSKHFFKAVEARDLKMAALWQANTGRNLSLGDFTAVNLARTDLPEDLRGVDYCAMVRAVMVRHEEVRLQSLDPSVTLLACSGPEEEVALVWSLPESRH